ncbi:glycosyltransferase [Acinetobacter nectaris]|uniref:glycosyltransferase n=1 Tax=Acinetobacter nectaris TaxID=1219382 RepID=UPI001F1A68E3|nr:glycosyltransferase family 2 protein [Acinetobacter nectaris]MCF9045712.1 glycosyltransferase family 2 protein [Acinetobacter nectaris]
MQRRTIASIVIYKHDYEELEPTLTSLINSPDINKIILVDNDQSSWANTDIHEKIHYLKSEGNFGFGFGHNKAIKAFAKETDFFIICNPDIAFEKEQLKNLLNYAESSSKGMFLPKIIKGDGSNQQGARLLPTPLNLFARRFSPKLAEKLDQQYLLKDFKENKPIEAPNLIGCFLVFRSSVLIELNGFDERFFMYMEDIDLSRRCYEKFGAVYYPLAHVTHLHEQGSYKNPVLLKAHIKSAIQYFNKWGWAIDSRRKDINTNCLKQLS